MELQDLVVKKLNLQTNSPTTYMYGQRRMILYKNEDNVLDSAPAETVEYRIIRSCKF